MNKNIYINFNNENNEIKNSNVPLSSSIINNNFEDNQNNYLRGQQGMGSFEMIGYKPSYNMENSEVYGDRGLNYIGENPPASALRHSDIIRKTEYQTTFSNTLFNKSTIKPLYTTETLTLPTKILQTKVNKVIVDNNVKALTLIYGRNNTTTNFENSNQGKFRLGYNLKGQGNQLSENVVY